jgi:hypothetical protein
MNRLQNFSNSVAKFKYQQEKDCIEMKRSFILAKNYEKFGHKTKGTVANADLGFLFIDQLQRCQAVPKC